MKKLIGLFTLLGMMFGPLAFANEEEIFYTEDDDELFNRGKFVGEENNDWMKAQKRMRNKNWAIALGTTALGIATVIFVGNNKGK